MDPGELVLLAPSSGSGRTGNSVSGGIRAMTVPGQVSLGDFSLPHRRHQHQEAFPKAPEEGRI